jgi:hypothetical protein
MAGGIEARAIFISYRRDDSEGEAGRLYDDLVRAYSDDSVFMDVAGIQPGVDFRKAIDTNVGSCGVLLAIIGPTWATIADSAGNRRLESPDDYVRLEIASALKRNIPVIPVLVHDAHMPALELLPDDLKDLRYRNSVELTHARWNSDVTLLIAALKSYVTVDTKHQAEPVHANVPVQLPPPNSPEIAPTAKTKSFVPLGIAATILIAAIGGIFAFLHFHAAATQSPQPSPQAAVAPAQASASAPASTTAPIPASTPAPAPASTPASSPANSQASAGSATAMLGKWVIAKAIKGDADVLRQVAIADFNGQIMVSASGKCPDRLCPWGEHKASLSNGAIVTESWDLRNTPLEQQMRRNVSLSIVSTADGLEVTLHNHWQDQNGTARDTYVPVQMRRAG